MPGEEESRYKDRLRSNSKSESNMAGRGQAQGQGGQKNTVSTPGTGGKQTPGAKGSTVTNEQIWEAIQAMQTTLSGVKNELDSAKGMASRVDTVTQTQTIQQTKLSELEDTTKEQDIKIRILTNVVIKQEESIEELQSQVKELKRGKIRRNVRISGLIEDSSETNEETKTKVNEFIQEELEISEAVKLKKAYRVGAKQGQDREVVAVLDSVTDKAKIFSNVKNLKGKKNVKRKLYFVNDDLDAEQREEKQRFRELVKEDKAAEAKLEIKFVRNRIVVNNEIITSKVSPPKASEILRLTDEERQAIKAVKQMSVGGTFGREV